MALSSLARIWGKCSTIDFLPALFFEAEVSSGTLIPRFMSGSVHSGSAHQKKLARKVNSGENSPAGIRTRNLSITSPALLPESCPGYPRSVKYGRRTYAVSRLFDDSAYWDVDCLPLDPKMLKYNSDRLPFKGASRARFCLPVSTSPSVCIAFLSKSSAITSTTVITSLPSPLGSLSL